MAEQGPIVFCTGGGCTAKLGAGVLSRILEKLPRGEKDPNLLVGYDSRDDAAVYRVTEDLALVQTVDFFPPMVDDPYTFGQIAAANALSDVYGYIEREKLIADKLNRLENLVIANKFNYMEITSLSYEARQKLTKINPKTIGQASRITGVSPSDINVLLILLGR